MTLLLGDARSGHRHKQIYDAMECGTASPVSLAILDPRIREHRRDLCRRLEAIYGIPRP